MSLPSLVIFFIYLWGACLRVGIVAGQECHQAGPIVPRPDLTRSIGFQDATERLADILNTAVNGSIKAGWDVPNVSFSVAVVTLDQLSAGVPIWEYHHLASNSSNGTQTIDRDSQYMIGSISKALTMAVVLRGGMNLDDPVTKYLPELGDSPSLIAWENITLRALASHMSGIPPNSMYGFGAILVEVIIDHSINSRPLRVVLLEELLHGPGLPGAKG
jgi:CubicO group peptidase (beta-lactamase class C family)